MQSISLVPSTPYDNSIYISDRKNCNGGLIMLEDRIIDYYMDVQETTAVSVDMSLLHLQPNSMIEFTLIVYSTGNNVLNLSGFNIEQIQVLNGQSVFTVMKGVSDALWTIQMDSSDVRPESWLKCSYNLRTPSYNQGIFTPVNFRFTTDDYHIVDYIFNEMSPGQIPNKGYCNGTGISNIGTIYVKFPTPTWIKSIYTGITNNSSDNLSLWPTSVQLYGSNDGENWTQILNDQINVVFNSSESHICSTTNYYTFFKFDFVFSSTTFRFPSVSIVGFVSELINTGCFQQAVPYISNNSMTLPYCGYNIETNLPNTSKNLIYITRFWSSDGGDCFYPVTRPNSSTPWEYIYTFPDPIRTVGITFKNWENNNTIKLFSLSYSDDKETWTEYCKVDGTIDAWVSNTYYSQFENYFYDSRSKHKYYKVTIYSNTQGTNYLSLNSLQFIKFQEGKYFDFETFMPKLSSNAQSGYALIASDSSNGDAYKMFDYSLTTYGGGTISNGEWSLLIQLPEATIVRGLQLIAPTSEVNRMPHGFSLLGSNDNENWTNIKQFFLGTNFWNSVNQVGNWDVENETAYKYYKLVVVGTDQGSYVRIGELGLSSYPSFKGVNWFEDENLVPIMSSNSQDGYIASASSYDPNHPPYCVFDGNNGVYYKWFSDVVSGSWIKIELPIARCANVFTIQTPNESGYQNRVPTEFKIQGSNDDDSWTDLVDVSNITWSNNETKKWVSDNTTNYKYYRILVFNNGGAVNQLAIGEWKLIERIYHERN